MKVLRLLRAVIFQTQGPWQLKIPECAYIANLELLTPYVSTVSRKLIMEIPIACLPMHRWSVGEHRVANPLGHRLLHVILYPPSSFDIIAFHLKRDSGPLSETCARPSYVEETGSPKPGCLPQNNPYSMKLFWIKNFDLLSNFHSVFPVVRTYNMRLAFGTDFKRIL